MRVMKMDSTSSTEDKIKTTSSQTRRKFIKSSQDKIWVCPRCKTRYFNDIEENPKQNIQCCCSGSNVGLERGGTVALCTCEQSNSYPFCDKTHEAINRDVGTNIKPLLVTTTELEGIASTRLRKNNNDVKTLDKETQTDTTLEDQTNNNSVDSCEEEPRNSNSSPTPLTPAKLRNAIKKVDKKCIAAIFTEEEVAEHNKNDDCWMIIKGKVYDVSNYFELHPGGQRALMNFAGKDATENVQFHSPRMMYLLDTYFYIGKLNTFASKPTCIIS